MRKNYITSTIITASSLLLLIMSSPSYADQWKGYVCKAMDMIECGKGNKRIFPRPERYDDKDTCYEEFEKIYVIDPEMNRLYPQTNNAYESYIMGCVKA